MDRWGNGELFRKLGLPSEMARLESVPLDTEWSMYTIEPEVYLDVHHYFISGGELMQRINSEGSLELIVLLDHEDGENAINSEWGFVTKPRHSLFEVEFKVYDQEDSPLELPFIFELNDAEQRYSAAAFCEQQELNVFVVSWMENKLTMIDFITFEWTDEIRKEILQVLLEAMEIRQV